MICGALLVFALIAFRLLNRSFLSRRDKRKNAASAQAEMREQFSRQMFV
jgi:hypothetical protein